MATSKRHNRLLGWETAKALLSSSGIGLFCLMTATTSSASTELDDIFELDLKALSQLEITTLNNRPQSSFELPAAIYVITRNDIETSGATTVPDLLIRIPGVFVRQPNKDSFAISIRNDNQFFNANMLILIDGKAHYLPITNNIVWRFLPVMVEDIQRIEVIRGNGGTAWGTNASAGVINIITQKSDGSGNSRIRAGLGNQNYQRLHAITNQGQLRLAAHADHSDSFSDSPSDHKSQSVNARYSNQWSGWDINVSGNVFKSQTYTIQTLLGPIADRDDMRLFDYSLDAGRHIGPDHLAFKLYRIDHKTDFSLLGTQNIHQKITAYEARYRKLVSDTQRLQVSANFREYNTHYPPGLLAKLVPEKINESLFNTVIDYEQDLTPLTRFNAGLRYETFSLTDDGLVSGSLRLSHRLAEQSQLWASLNYSHQFPTFTTTNIDVITNQAGTTISKQRGNPDLKAEQYKDVQFGIRHHFTKTTQTNLSLHYVDVEDEIFVDPATASTQTVGPLTIITSSFANHVKSTSWGAEFTLKHHFNKNYTTELGLTYFNKDASHKDNLSRPNINDQYAPKWKTTLLNNFRLTSRTRLYLFLDWETSHNYESVSIYVPPNKTGERFRMDANLRHQFTKKLTLDTGFKNLFNDKVDWEYIFISANPVEVEPSFFTHLTYQF